MIPIVALGIGNGFTEPVVGARLVLAVVGVFLLGGSDGGGFQVAPSGQA
jgi:hypothetical protein